MLPDKHISFSAIKILLSWIPTTECFKLGRVTSAGREAESVGAHRDISLSKLTGAVWLKKRNLILILKLPFHRLRIQ